MILFYLYSITVTKFDSSKSIHDYCMSPRLCVSTELKQFQVNLIYLASLSGRVPIIPPFIPGPHLREFFFLENTSYPISKYLLSWNRRSSSLQSNLQHHSFTKRPSSTYTRMVRRQIQSFTNFNRKSTKL